MTDPLYFHSYLFEKWGHLYNNMHRHYQKDLMNNIYIYNQILAYFADSYFLKGLQNLLCSKSTYYMFLLIYYPIFEMICSSQFYFYQLNFIYVGDDCNMKFYFRIDDMAKM